MTIPTVTLQLNDRVISTVESYISRKPADVLFEHNLLFGALWNADKMPGTPGERPKGINVPSGRVKRRNARELWLPMATNRATTVEPFSGADTLKTNIDDVGTVQRFGYSYYTGYAGMTLTEHLENTGPDAIMDIFQNRVDSVFRTFSEEIETDLWGSGDGTTVDANDQNKRVLGIEHLLPNVPSSGTVWNIDRSTETYHRPNAINAADSFANVGLDKMRRMRTSVSGTSGVDGPSIIMATSELWEAYVKEAESIHQATQIKVANMTAEAAVYGGIPVAYSALCGTGKMFWLNLKYWYLFLQPGAIFTPYQVGMPANQLIWKSWRIVLSIQWGCERYDRQGVIYGFTDV